MTMLYVICQSGPRHRSRSTRQQTALARTPTISLLLAATPPEGGRRPNYAAIPAPPTPPPPPLPFRQDALWAACTLLFFGYLTLVLYLFLTSPPFQQALITHANGLFALPYLLSLLVVALCLFPCAPPPRRELDGVIANPVDLLLVLLVLLEWATCLALVLVTLIAVNEGLSYINQDGFIVPAQGDGEGGEGVSRDSTVVLLVPVLFMYALFNFVLHVASCVEATWRRQQERLRDEERRRNEEEEEPV